MGGQGPRVAVQGPISDGPVRPTTAARCGRQQGQVLPPSRPSPRWLRTAQSGGELTLRPFARTVRIAPNPDTGAPPEAEIAQHAFPTMGERPRWLTRSGTSAHAPERPPRAVTAPRGWRPDTSRAGLQAGAAPGCKR